MMFLLLTYQLITQDGAMMKDIRMYQKIVSQKPNLLNNVLTEFFHSGMTLFAQISYKEREW